MLSCGGADGYHLGYRSAITENPTSWTLNGVTEPGPEASRFDDGIAPNDRPHRARTFVVRALAAIGGRSAVASIPRTPAPRRGGRATTVVGALTHARRSNRE